MTTEQSNQLQTIYDSIDKLLDSRQYEMIYSLEQVLGKEQTTTREFTIPDTFTKIGAFGFFFDNKRSSGYTYGMTVNTDHIQLYKYTGNGHSFTLVYFPTLRAGDKISYTKTSLDDYAHQIVVKIFTFK